MPKEPHQQAVTADQVCIVTYCMSSDNCLFGTLFQLITRRSLITSARNTHTHARTTHTILTTIFKTNGVGQFSPWFSSSKLPHQTTASDSNTDPARKNQLHAAFFLDLPTYSKEKGPFSDASTLKGNSQIPLCYPGCRQVRSWSQTC